ncbi:hypothetical protein [Pseudomonas sp. A-RE-19]|uniref:hypothetical protein n=1 Tax=Pseudomonas sp. A-RE-19 TaxID=2832401 RepID=UPI001CC0FF55|nr:hypothetical protein [Pseudomonas sp. A-RE-19]
MKNLLFSIGLATFSIQAFAAQPQLNSVINCELAGPNHTASLLRSSSIEDSYVYKIRHDKQTRFMYDDSTESRGSEVQWQCTSGEQYLNALVISGEFTSNFIQGVLFYFDSGDGKIERIDFAERNRPRWVKISAKGAQVIFENTGNESSSKYLSYGKHEAYLELSELPATSAEAGETLIDLNNAKQ